MLTFAVIALSSAMVTPLLAQQQDLIVNEDYTFSRVGDSLILRRKMPCADYSTTMSLSALDPTSVSRYPDVLNVGDHAVAVLCRAPKCVESKATPTCKSAKPAAFQLDDLSLTELTQAEAESVIGFLSRALGQPALPEPAAAACKNVVTVNAVDSATGKPLPVMFRFSLTQAADAQGRRPPTTTKHVHPDQPLQFTVHCGTHKVMVAADFGSGYWFREDQVLGHLSFDVHQDRQTSLTIPFVRKEKRP